jgi:hypothetical protein
METKAPASQTNTVCRPASFNSRHPGMTAAGYLKLKREAASRFPVVLACAEGAFSHLKIQFEAYETCYAQGIRDDFGVEKLQEGSRTLFDVLDAGLWDMGTKTKPHRNRLKADPAQQPFDAVSEAFHAVEETFDYCRQANKAGNLTDTDLFNLLSASERLQNVVYDMESDKEDQSRTEAGEPLFEHRLSPIAGIRDASGLYDTVNGMTKKAIAMVAATRKCFAEDNADRPSSETVFYMLMAVEHELADIRSVFRAFYLNDGDR